MTVNPPKRLGRLKRRCLELALGLITAAALFGTVPGAHAQERVWAGMILASQAEHPVAAPAELAKVAGKVERVFGYNQVELLGTATKKFENDTEHWLVPNQHFWLSVKAKRIPENKYHLQITLINDKRTLLETEARVAADCPILIRGPMHPRGQLIISLQVLK